MTYYRGQGYVTQPEWDDAGAGDFTQIGSREHIARKEHPCHECGKAILQGERYTVLVFRDETGFHQQKRHKRNCQPPDPFEEMDDTNPERQTGGAEFGLYEQIVPEEHLADMWKTAEEQVIAALEGEADPRC